MSESDENFCQYIGSVGFKKSCDFNLTNEINADLVKKMNGCKVIYIKTDIIYEFSKLINDVATDFVLVTGCSDYTIPNDIFPNIEDFLTFVANKKLLKWYVQNCIYKHDKIINLPIGLDFHTLSANDNFWWGPRMNPIEQEKQLIDIKNCSSPFYKRECRIYSNCHFQMHTKYGYDRRDAMNNVPNNLLHLEGSRITRIDTWKNQINYSFVLSPHGNGLDCHRTWEALVLGCIPIVKTSAIDSLYDDLPVLIVSNWEDVNEELLKNTIHKFTVTTFNYDKLKLRYWMNLIRTIE